MGKKLRLKGYGLSYSLSFTLNGIKERMEKIVDRGGGMETSKGHISQGVGQVTRRGLG